MSAKDPAEDSEYERYRRGHTSVLELARQYVAAGINVLPVRPDGSKAPAVAEWAHLQNGFITNDEIDRYWSNGPRNGIAAIGGAISGGLEDFDFDDPDVFAGWKKLVIKELGQDFWKQLLIVGTPRPGFQVPIRSTAAGRSQKLASRPNPNYNSSNPASKKVIGLIETKGDGGYFLLPGCPPECHPTGRTYERIQGSYTRVPFISSEQREVLISFARSFDEMPRAVYEDSPTEKRERKVGMLLPGDDYNQRAEWKPLLERHGFKCDSMRGETSYWTRPGKNHGISASTNHNGSELFYPFSTSLPFDTERGYSKFTVLAILEHGGDFSAAAKELYRQGYGTRHKKLADERNPRKAQVPAREGEEGDEEAEYAAITAEENVELDNTREGELVLDPTDPLPTARIFVEQFHVVDAVRALQHHAGVFYDYQQRSSAYAEMDEAAVRAKLYSFLEPAMRWSEPKGKSREQELVPFKPTKAKVENVLDALRAVCNLPASSAPPCWLKSSGLSPLDMVACRNGLLYLPARRLLEPTPLFFTLNGIDFEFNMKAPKPGNWLSFLDQLWPDDLQSVETLQEWMGYLLTARTHFQKMLMLVGPKRSGKGTIGRVNRMLLGDRNVCGPTLANMSEQFGLSILVGKSAAIIADARIGGRADTAVITERLLSISGEDTLSIPRKFLPDWNGKLPTRFMLMTNELPRIEDASGAIASRFIILTLSQSFYGREDHGLLDRFIPELPGILLWAIDGWERLNRRGRFIQPASSAELIQQFEDLGSPIGAFVRERCEVGRAHSVTVDGLFQAWKAWCADNGRERPGTSQAFGRNLRALLPWLRISQPRVAGDRIRYYEGIRLEDEY